MSILSSIGSSLAGTALRAAGPWLIAGAVAGAAGLYLLAYNRGENYGRLQVQYEWDRSVIAIAAQNRDIEAQHRAREQSLQVDNQRNSDALHLQLETQETDYIVALDAVRSDRNRLRKQFQGCAAGLSSSDPTTGTASSNDAAGNSGLSEEDQRVALSIGRDANRVVAKLQACQSYVRSIQSTLERE